MNVDEWSEIQRCHRDGESIKGIAARLGMSRNTVRRALAMDTPPDDHRRRSGRVTDDIDAAVRDLLVAAPGIGIAEISRRIGWTRSRTMLARTVTEIRAELEAAKRDSQHIAAGVPTPATTFVGRRAELRELRGLLGEHRLVSIVGPGGIGKTRLSIQAAYEFRRAFPDGVRFVEFAAIRTPELLAQVVCDGLALDNRDAHHRSPEQVLIEYLRNRRMLLVLDNCEHVVDATAALVARLLEATSGLRVLSTTREYLAIPGEYVFDLPPLPTHAGAVELFGSRAAEVLSGFRVTDENIGEIERICDRLDGLPLAIELACARLTVLSLGDLSGLLEHRLSVLTAGARARAPRHRSLPAAIDWSYELCTGPERLLWTRLSVFTDGFELAAAVRVCADDRLPAALIMDTTAALVAKSIVRREEHGGGVRFRMLEAIREYGHDRLTAPERDELRGRLAGWCAEVVRATAAGWYGPDQLRHVAAVERNRGNIRAALESALSDPGDPVATGHAAAALGASLYLWACGISVREHRMWLTRLVDLPGIDPAARARALAVLALVQVLQGDRDAAGYTLHRAREHGDAALLTHLRGLRELFAGELDAAAASMAEARAGYAACGSPPDLVTMLRIHRGMLYSATGEIDRARDEFAAVHAETTAVGEHWFHSYAIYGLGLVALRGGDWSAAREHALRGLRIQRRFGDVLGTTLLAELLGWALAGLSAAAARESGAAARDSAATAAVLLGATSASWGSIGQQLYGSESWIALRERAIETARGRVGEQAFERAGVKGSAMSLTELLEFGAAEPAPAPAAAERDRLTPREREVAAWVAEGLTNRQIAEKLVLSTRTVEGHVEHLLRKLGLRRRVELAAAGVPR
ncbi:ATP-binding protein [Nocardia sp. NPDC057353]|uniref:ATP-binding protein n=1 Tax=Nocardia sp. NPDC057353 TaxID=3346104 RepID=UPI0036452E82